MAETELNGVPVEWVNGGDFVQVSVDMTKALDGDFIAAALAGRVRFVSKYGTIDEDGLIWVDTSVAEFADGMGISVKQVRRALTVLENAGYIKRMSRSRDSWDRIISTALIYRG